MGLFSRKTDDTKARIEELKKKIQAEQQAYTSSTKEQQSAPANLPPPAQPAPQAAPAPQAQQVQEVVVEQPAPVEAVTPRVAAQPMPARHAPEPRVRETLSFDPPMPTQQPPRVRSEPLGDAQGVVLDLGEGMSLNVPVRTRMHLDEFLGVADKVRELQRLQRPGFH